MLYTSQLNGEVIRNTPQKLASIYEAQGYQAVRGGDHVEAQIFFNYAEHWKKVHKGY